MGLAFLFIQLIFHSFFISGMLLYLIARIIHCDPGLFYMLHIISIYHRMVLYILTGYRVLRIVYLDQRKGAHHTHISYHNIPLFFWGSFSVHFMVLSGKFRYFWPTSLLCHTLKPFALCSCVIIWHTPFLRDVIYNWSLTCSWVYTVQKN